MYVDKDVEKIKRKGRDAQQSDVAMMGGGEGRRKGKRKLVWIGGNTQ